MTSKDIIELNERIKELKRNRLDLEDKLEETLRYADRIASTDGDSGAEELPALEIEIDRLETSIDMIDVSIEELQDEIEEIKELLGDDYE